MAKRAVGKKTTEPVVEETQTDEFAAQVAAAVKAFGESLLAARKATKLTQVEVSKRSGVSQSHISQLEGGNLEPRLTTILSLAAALQVAPADLLPKPEALSYYGPSRSAGFNETQSPPYTNEKNNQREETESKQQFTRNHLRFREIEQFLYNNLNHEDYEEYLSSFEIVGFNGDNLIVKIRSHPRYRFVTQTYIASVIKQAIKNITNPLLYVDFDHTDLLHDEIKVGQFIPNQQE